MGRGNIMKKSNSESSLKVALVGCGRIADRHYDSWRMINNVDLILCDVNKKNLLKYSKSDAHISCCNSYSDILKDSRIEIIDLCTPSGLHPSMAILAANHKKHVICEKPLALNYEDACKVVSVFKKEKRLLAVVFQNRLNPPVSYLKNCLNKKMLGRINIITATVRWYRDKKYYSDGWHGKKSMDGGILYNQAIHYVDILLYLKNCNVKSVYCYSSTLHHKIEIDDVVVMILKFEDGTVGLIEASTISCPKNMEGSVALQCDKASLKIGGSALNKIEYWEGACKPVDDKNIVGEDVESIYGKSHNLVIHNFHNAVNNKTSALCSGEDALYAMKVISAAYKSVNSGREEKV